jgi:putative MATE family efflux protein
MQNSHPLGVDKISRLLFSYSMPTIVAMTASSLYNIIDRIFIGRIGADAISGVALTLPFMNMGVAIGSLVVVGSAALVSIRIGEKRPEEAAKILGNTATLNLVLGLSYSAVMLYFLDDVLIFFGASSNTLPYAHDFMKIILLGNVILHSYMGFNYIMRASGYPVKAMVTTLITVCVNIILAPLFIFKFGWGIQGAAFATYIAPLAGLIYTVIHFIKKTSSLRFTRGTFGFEKRIVLDIFSIGMSPFVINLGSCVTAIFVNRQLVRYGGDFAVGAFGIVNSIIMCVVMIVLGLAHGMQPIAGFNYGARQFQRVRDVFRLTVIASTVITTFAFLISEIFPGYISRAFTDSDEIIGAAVFGLRAGLLIFPFVGFQLIAANFFQSIGKAKISVVLALSRQVFFLIPSLTIVPLFFGLTGVWTALPVADFLSVTLTFFVYLYEKNKIMPAS